jgi:hypothetical protein
LAKAWWARFEASVACRLIDKQKRVVVGIKA